MEKLNFDPNKKRVVTRKLGNTGRSEIFHVPIDPQGAEKTIENLRRQIILKYETVAETPKSVQAFLKKDAMPDAEEIGLADSSSNQSRTETRIVQEGTTVTLDAEGRLMYGDLLLQGDAEKDKARKNKKEGNYEKYREKYAVGRYIIDQRNPQRIETDVKVKTENPESKSNPNSPAIETSANKFVHVGEASNTAQENTPIEEKILTHQRYTNLEKAFPASENLSQQVNVFYENKIKEFFSDKATEHIWERAKNSPAEVIFGQKPESVTKELQPLAHFMHEIRDISLTGPQDSNASIETSETYIKRALQLIFKRDGNLDRLDSA